MKRILGLLTMGATLLVVFSGCGQMTEGAIVEKTVETEETYVVIGVNPVAEAEGETTMTHPTLPAYMWEETETVMTHPTLPAYMWQQAETVMTHPTLPAYMWQETETVMTHPTLPAYMWEKKETELTAPTLPAYMWEKKETELTAPTLPDYLFTTESKESETEMTNPPAPWLSTNDVVETEMTNPPAPWLNDMAEEELTPPPMPEFATHTETKTETVKLIPTADFSEIAEAIEEQKGEYPGMHIGVGLYTLDGTQLFGYNVYEEMQAGCTVKAYYAKYVLEQCEKEGIDIWSETLTYKSYHLNTGSGVIKDIFEPGDELTINYLLTALLGESDNTAFNILLERFTLSDYQIALDQIDGQNLYGARYGIVSVSQRKNEWLSIWKYVNSDAQYAETLRDKLSNTKYCYLVQGMSEKHTYLHKSGWISDDYFTCAADCAIVDDQYLLIVLTYDEQDDISNAGAVKAIARAAERAVENSGIF